MKIKYVHASEPNKTKIHDTVRSLKNNPFVKWPTSQEEWDKFELSKFKEDKKTGLIISYEIIQEEL